MVVEMIKKDLVYLVTSLKSTIITMCIISLFLPMANVSYACVMPALVCYIGFYSLMAYEERNKMHIFNISLPVDRKDICLSKYVEVLLYILVSSILALLGVKYAQVTLMNTEQGIEIKTIEIITVMFSLGMVYSAVMLPTIFYFGTIKARYVLLLIYVLIFVGANSIKNDVIEKVLTKIMGVFNGSLVLMFVIAAAVFIASYIISNRIWDKKEF